MPARIIRSSEIIAHDDLVPLVGGVPTVLEELAYILDVLVASAQGVLTTCVVDADEQGLLADHNCESVDEELLIVSAVNIEFALERNRWLTRSSGRMT